MSKLPLLILSLGFLMVCGQPTPEKSREVSPETVESSHSLINESGTTVQTRFNPPEGYRRKRVGDSSFASYLRNLPLKKHGAKVRYYDGSYKVNQVYDAVIDLEIGKRDLHQCADAIMRLRAEYLWKRKQYEAIHFNFTNGFRVDYKNWMDGQRVVVNGNRTYWTQRTHPSNDYPSFWKYMELIFSYAGTLSLAKELNPVDIAEMKIGDIFIQGGSPGHAVIVVDMAEKPETGETLFLLAQSYMPAQEIQILKNGRETDLSPWYSTAISQSLPTPEWSFRGEDLKRFP